MFIHRPDQQSNSHRVLRAGEVPKTCSRPLSLNPHVRSFCGTFNQRHLQQLDNDMGSPTPRDAAANEKPNNFALTPQALERPGRTTKRIVEEFDSRVTQGPRPAIPGQGFPDRVIYRHCCGQLCKQTTNVDKLRMHIRLVAGFVDLAKRFQNCTQLVGADVVLAMEVMGYRNLIWKGKGGVPQKGAIRVRARADCRSYMLVHFVE